MGLQYYGKTTVLPGERLLQLIGEVSLRSLTFYLSSLIVVVSRMIGKSRNNCIGKLTYASQNAIGLPQTDQHTAGYTCLSMCMFVDLF